MNRVCLIGRLAYNPELKMLPNGEYCCTFNVVVNHKDGAEFIQCFSKNGVAQVVGTNFRKGDKIGVDGKLHAYTYEAKYGYQKSAVEVVAEAVFFCEKKMNTVTEDLD